MAKRLGKQSEKKDTPSFGVVPQAQKQPYMSAHKREPSAFKTNLKNTENDKVSQ